MPRKQTLIKKKDIIRKIRQAKYKDWLDAPGLGASEISLIAKRLGIRDEGGKPYRVIS